jgi:hypothetical protein
MPSNADIIKAIAEAAEAAGVDVPETEGKNNAELAAILSELKKTDRKADKAEKLAEAAEAVKEDEATEEKKPPFSVAPGKAITSKRGILSEGDEVKAEDFPTGDKALKAFVKSGHIVKA